MDIQLHVTEEELKGFPEDLPDHTDLDIAPSSTSIPKADLPITPANLPRAKAKCKGFLGSRQPVNLKPIGRQPVT